MALKSVVLCGLWDKNGKANLQVVEETLTDGSKAYNVLVGTYEYAAVSAAEANKIFGMILSFATGRDGK